MTYSVWHFSKKFIIAIPFALLPFQYHDCKILFFSFLYKTVEGISLSLHPLLCTSYTLNNVKWKLRNFSSVLLLPNENTSWRKIRKQNTRKWHAFLSVVSSFFFLPFILAGSFLSRQKKELKKQTKKVDRISTFFIGFISFFHHTITVTMDDRTHTACPIRNVLRVANGQKWCNKWQCVVLVTLVRRLTTTCRHTFVLSFPLSLCGTKKKLSTVARHT